MLRLQGVAKISWGTKFCNDEVSRGCEKRFVYIVTLLVRMSFRGVANIICVVRKRSRGE